MSCSADRSTTGPDQRFSVGHAAILFTIFVWMMTGAAVTHAADQPLAFVQAFCVECHRKDDASGEREFETLALNRSDQDTIVLLQEIVDQLTLGEMPPEDAVQPTLKERGRAIAELTAVIQEMRQTSRSTGGQTVLRRLTRREYLATIRDLFHLDVRMFDPTKKFPRENTSEHLDNIGNALVTSSYLLEQYLEGADAIVEKALRSLDKPKEQRWEFHGPFRQQPELDSAHKAAFNQSVMCLYDSPLADKPEGAYGALHEFKQGVPQDGVYEIRVRAEALHRNTPYSEDTLRIDLGEPFRLGIRPGSETVGSLHNIQPIQPLLEQHVIEDNVLRWYTFRVPLDQGLTPRFTFENGLEAIRPLYAKLFRQYKKTLLADWADASGIVGRRKALLRYGQMPQIRIHEVQIRGPVTEAWPAPSVTAILPDGTFDAENARDLIQRFADRAYRRPISNDELERLMSVYQARQEQGRDAFEAFKDALKVVLCSPSFLYLEPDCTDGSDQISQHALAARLSYFLTGSMPDATLRQLADQQRLDSRVLLDQARRLLESVESDSMIQGLTDAWLNLRSLGEMPPDRDSFWRYYASDLRDDMRRETQSFFRHLVDENLPVTEWISADYSFINRDLAKLYGIENEIEFDDADQLQKFTFDDRRRGGLLGQASVLTVSANGIETSPVTRGVWMLENVLGTPPAPPPDDVPAIDPDVRGAKSIRDLLDKHRNTEACNQCHRKIDPMGFAMESFDPIGQIRTHYEKRTPIDTAGKLPSGQSFDDIVGLKALLMERKAFFARAFVRKTLAYALGRQVESSDRAEVDSILEVTEAEGYPTRTLLERIVTSDSFRRR